MQISDDPTGRDPTFDHVSNLLACLAHVIQIKEETWSYHVPNVEEAEIKTISIGLDGTCLLMCGGAYRQAMVGTIALYDEKGERQHTMYIVAPPEYGKEKFKARLLQGNRTGNRSIS